MHHQECTTTPRQGNMQKQRKPRAALPQENTKLWSPACKLVVQRCPERLTKPALHAGTSPTTHTCTGVHAAAPPHPAYSLAVRGRIAAFAYWHAVHTRMQASGTFQRECWPKLEREPALGPHLEHHMCAPGTPCAQWLDIQRTTEACRRQNGSASAHRLV